MPTCVALFGRNLYEESWVATGGPMAGVKVAKAMRKAGAPAQAETQRRRDGDSTPARGLKESFEDGVGRKAARALLGGLIAGPAGAMTGALMSRKDEESVVDLARRGATALLN